jgi:hypothetical protein
MARARACVCVCSVLIVATCRRVLAPPRPAACTPLLFCTEAPGPFFLPVTPLHRAPYPGSEGPGALPMPWSAACDTQPPNDCCAEQCSIM